MTLTNRLAYKLDLCACATQRVKIFFLLKKNCSSKAYFEQKYDLDYISEQENKADI